MLLKEKEKRTSLLFWINSCGFLQPNGKKKQTPGNEFYQQWCNQAAIKYGRSFLNCSVRKVIKFKK